MIDEVDKSIIDSISSVIEDIGLLKFSIIEQHRMMSNLCFDISNRVTRLQDKVRETFNALTEKHSKYDMRQLLTAESNVVKSLIDYINGINKQEWVTTENKYEVKDKIIIEKLKTKIKLIINKNRIPMTDLTSIMYMDDITIKKRDIVIGITESNLDNIKAVLKNFAY